MGSMCGARLFERGEKYHLTPYGTETMHVLRAEKGFIIAGQDTDGSVHPYDLGMGWAVSPKKAFSFIGKRGMARDDCVRDDRKQWVGYQNQGSCRCFTRGCTGCFRSQRGDSHAYGGAHYLELLERKSTAQYCSRVREGRSRSDG